MPKKIVPSESVSKELDELLNQGMNTELMDSELMLSQLMRLTVRKYQRGLFILRNIRKLTRRHPKRYVTLSGYKTEVDLLTQGG